MNIVRCLSLCTIWSEYLPQLLVLCSLVQDLQASPPVSCFCSPSVYKPEKTFCNAYICIHYPHGFLNSEDTVRKNGLNPKVPSCNNPQTKALIRSGSFEFSGLSHWSWTLQDSCFPLWSASPWSATLAVLQIYPIILWDIMAGTSRRGEQASPRKAIGFMV